MTQFPYLTKGAVGRVTFDHLNQVFDASARVLSESVRVPGVRGIPPKGLWVELLAAETVGGLSAWTWRAICKGASAIETNAELLSSSLFDGDGRAYELGGDNAAAGDFVLIYPLASYDGTAWFGFSKGGGTVTRLLPIVSATGSSPPYSYLVSVDGESVEAINQYEQDPYGYGQDLTFTNGSLVPAPCQGSPPCHLIGGTWYFSEQNPMTPNCSA